MDRGRTFPNSAQFQEMVRWHNISKLCIVDSFRIIFWKWREWQNIYKLCTSPGNLEFGRTFLKFQNLLDMEIGV
jgi:hypothetical protein